MGRILRRRKHGVGRNVVDLAQPTTSATIFFYFSSRCCHFFVVWTKRPDIKATSYPSDTMSVTNEEAADVAAEKDSGEGNSVGSWSHMSCEESGSGDTVGDFNHEPESAFGLVSPSFTERLKDDSATTASRQGQRGAVVATEQVKFVPQDYDVVFNVGVTRTDLPGHVLLRTTILEYLSTKEFVKGKMKETIMADADIMMDYIKKFAALIFRKKGSRAPSLYFYEVDTTKSHGRYIDATPAHFLTHVLQLRKDWIDKAKATDNAATAASVFRQSLATILAQEEAPRTNPVPPPLILREQNSLATLASKFLDKLMMFNNIENETQKQAELFKHFLEGFSKNSVNPAFGLYVQFADPTPMLQCMYNGVHETFQGMYKVYQGLHTKLRRNLKDSPDSTGGTPPGKPPSSGSSGGSSNPDGRAPKSPPASSDGNKKRKGNKAPKSNSQKQSKTGTAGNKSSSQQEKDDTDSEGSSQQEDNFYGEENADDDASESADDDDASESADDASYEESSTQMEEQESNHSHFDEDDADDSTRQSHSITTRFSEELSSSSSASSSMKEEVRHDETLTNEKVDPVGSLTDTLDELAFDNQDVVRLASDTAPRLGSGVHDSISFSHALFTATKTKSPTMTIATPTATQPTRVRASFSTGTTTPLIDPLPETYDPVFYNCVSHPIGCTVLLYEADAKERMDVAYDADQKEEEGYRVNVMRTMNPQQAYVQLDSKPSIPLDHHAPDWGCVYFGFVVHRVPGDLDTLHGVFTFQCPYPNQVQHVAIKRLKRSVVDQYLKAGGHENPYKEVSRMQQYGDNVHVLGCIEALHDDTFLYIITPYCEYGSLLDVIPWEQSHMILEDQVCAHFVQLLQVLEYLQRHGICHRDLSLDNIMIYQGRLVVADLAMSFRIPLPQEASAPHGGQAPAPVLVRPLGGCGQTAYEPPEVRQNRPFDPYACDLWSSMVALFKSLTGEILYGDCTLQNLKFLFFVLAHGCSRTPMNELTEELQGRHVRQLAPEAQVSFQRMVHKMLQFSPEVLELLEGVLQVEPQNRWNLARVQDCQWIKNYRSKAVVTETTRPSSSMRERQR
jgi:serine/threonine protein kinase